MRCRDHREGCRANRANGCVALSKLFNGQECPFYKTQDQWDQEIYELRMNGHKIKYLVKKEED